MNWRSVFQISTTLTGLPQRLKPHRAEHRSLSFAFPPTFLFGAATAAHQVEGGTCDNNWARWERTSRPDGRPGIFTGESCGQAAAHWELFEQDLERMRHLGLSMYRFSIEWSRIEPREGEFDEVAMRRYRDWCEQLTEAGIKPMVTLHHFTEPAWITERGGFEDREREISHESFLLAYVLNSGYADRIVRWHERRPDIPVHCFWDSRTVPDEYSPSPNITFHRLHDRKFLSMMARCRGLVCTAGFESVCEAMYLGKPTWLILVEGHYEQACNALDAMRSRAGIAGNGLDIDRFIEYIETYGQRDGFRGWADSAPRRFVEELESAAGADEATHEVPSFSLQASSPVEV